MLSKIRNFLSGQDQELSYTEMVSTLAGRIDRLEAQNKTLVIELENCAAKLEEVAPRAGDSSVVFVAARARETLQSTTSVSS